MVLSTYNENIENGCLKILEQNFLDIELSTPFSIFILFNFENRIMIATHPTNGLGVS